MSAGTPRLHETDPDKYHLMFENERVRVFEYKDEPGQKTKLHHHDAFFGIFLVIVLIAIVPLAIVTAPTMIAHIQAGPGTFARR